MPVARWLVKPELVWLTDRQTAAHLGVGVASVWKWTREGKLPAPRRMGRTTRWYKPALDAAGISTSTERTL